MNKEFLRSYCFVLQTILSYFDSDYLPDDIHKDIISLSDKLDDVIGKGFIYCVLWAENPDDDSEFFEVDLL